MITGSSARTRCARVLRVAVAAIALCAASAGALAAEPAWGLPQLMQRLAQVKAVEGEFVERKHLRILDAPLEFSGTLTYKAPAYLQKRTRKPKPQGLTVERDRMTVEDGSGKRRTLMLDDQPLAWAFVESIRATLAGDLQTLERYYKVRLEGGQARWQLTLEPTEPTMASLIDAIRIAGSHDRIGVVETVEAGGDRSVMTITEKAPRRDAP